MLLYKAVALGNPYSGLCFLLVHRYDPEHCEYYGCGGRLKTVIKIFLVAWVAVILALLVNKYLLPASASTMAEYQALRAELATQAEITEQQQQRLETLFLQLNRSDNIKQDVLGFVAKNVLFFLLMVPLTFWLARNSGFDNNAVLISAALIFMPFIMVAFFITGAVLASAFVLGGIAFRKSPVLAADSESGER